jgi:hypothetical protein
LLVKIKHRKRRRRFKRNVVKLAESKIRVGCGGGNGSQIPVDGGDQNLTIPLDDG